MNKIDSDKIRVLIFVSTYLPGERAGGPVRSIANLVGQVGQLVDFFIMTSDRDIDDKSSYSGIVTNRFCTVGNAQVCYSTSRSARALLRVFRQVRPDLVYLNSFHNRFTRQVLFLRRMGAFGDTPILLAPRGELAPGALRIKPLKKAIYLRAARFLGLYRNLFWQATCPDELNEVLSAAPAADMRRSSVYLAPNIPSADPCMADHAPKHAGQIKLVYLSRISRKKNLGFLLDLLPAVQGRIELDIYGPVGARDSEYWKECAHKLTTLPANVQARFHGPIPHTAVNRALHDHHFFVLPTWGENFCHAAVESLQNGTPVILSDTTPWRDLCQSSAGYDLPLDDRSAWIRALQACVDMDSALYQSLLEGAKNYGCRIAAAHGSGLHVAIFSAVASNGRSQPKLA